MKDNRIPAGNDCPATAARRVSQETYNAICRLVDRDDDADVDADGVIDNILRELAKIAEHYYKLSISEG